MRSLGECIPGTGIDRLRQPWADGGMTLDGDLTVQERLDLRSGSVEALPARLERATCGFEGRRSVR